MDFYTHISLPDIPFRFTYEEPILLLGSCFTENVGVRLEEAKFQVDINPFGTLYNPLSIAEALSFLRFPRPFTKDDLFCSGGLYHSFRHHSRFSALSAEACLARINQRLEYSSAFLRKCGRLMITWGTSWGYRLKENGVVVANCHKLPDRLFLRERLPISQIVTAWADLLEKLWEVNPRLKVLFTVSPIRHWKDGAHGNQLSKATLLLAIDELNRMYPDDTAYFPSYEILMDELRDYRFYAEDMIHPSEQAIDYIWEKFVGSALTPATWELLKKCEEIRKAVEHRPFNPESEAYRQFILQTLLKIDRLNEKMPFFDFSKERIVLKSKLK